MIKVFFTSFIFFYITYVSASTETNLSEENTRSQINKSPVSEKTNTKNNTQTNSESTSTKIKIPKQWIVLKKELKNRRSALTSPIVQRRLQRIHRVMNQKDSEDKALGLIGKLEEVVQKRPFDLTRLYHLKAQIYLSKDNFKKAFLYYNKAIDLKTLSHKEHLSVLYDMTTLYLFQNKIKKASDLIDQLFYLADTITPAAYILKASVLVEKKQKKKALELVMKAIQSTKNPKENWLAFGAALNLEMEKYVPAARLLTTLTASYPNKKKYWKQLSAVYLNINKDDKALATLDLAYKMDFLEKEQEIIHLASLLMYQGLPFKAGLLIEKFINLKKVEPTQKNYEILGDCWQRAEETNKALKAYQLSAPLAEDGKIFAKLGRIYMQNREWNAVVDNFTKALNKGGIKHPEHIYISMGIAYFQLKAYEQAIKSFEQVINTKATGQKIKIARQWINHTQSLMKNDTKEDI